MFSFLILIQREASHQWSSVTRGQKHLHKLTDNTLHMIATCIGFTYAICTFICLIVNPQGRQGTSQRGFLGIRHIVAGTLLHHTRRAIRANWVLPFEQKLKVKQYSFISFRVLSAGSILRKWGLLCQLVQHQNPAWFGLHFFPRYCTGFKPKSDWLISLLIMTGCDLSDFFSKWRFGLRVFLQHIPPITCFSTDFCRVLRVK